VILDLFRKQPAPARDSAGMASAIERVRNMDVPFGGDGVVAADSWQALRGIFGDMQPTDSGAIVNSATAMRVSAVYRSTALISGSVASQPVDIYQRDPKGKPIKIPNHPLWWALNESANSQNSAAVFKEWMTAQMLLRGDGLAYIIRAADGVTPVGFLPLRREQVVIQQRAPRSPKEPPQLVYFITTPWGSFPAEYDEMIHFPGFGFNGIESMSVIQWGARNAIGTAMRADEFAGRFFSQGAQPQFALKVPGKMSEEAKIALRESWQAKYQGNGPNGIPLVLTENIDVKELTMTAADAQLIESRKWQVADVARAFGVPPHMIGDTEKSTTWGSGLEELGQAYVDYTLSPHIKRLEEELTRKLFKRGTNYVRFNLDGLMRGNATARSTYYGKALGGTQNPAWMTANEVRELENLPPSDDPEADKLAQPKPGSGPNQGNTNADQSTPGT
jgi:HK97 family phage portal protein